MGRTTASHRRERVRRAAELLERFQLTTRADEMVRGFSGGMMQRLSIARAMMHDPEVLFLDEPSTGLDPQTKLLLWEIIREYNRDGKTILLTTHNMDEADALCHRDRHRRSWARDRPGDAGGAEGIRFRAAICCGCTSARTRRNWSDGCGGCRA